MKKEYSYLPLVLGLVALAIFASVMMNVAAFTQARARVAQKVRQQNVISPAQPPTPVVQEAVGTGTAPELK